MSDFELNGIKRLLAQHGEPGSLLTDISERLLGEVERLREMESASSKVVEIKQFGRYQARIKFRSGNGYEVKPECKPFNGERVIVDAQWIIETGDTVYPGGEWAMRVYRPVGYPMAFIASGDLEDIVEFNPAYTVPD